MTGDDRMVSPEQVSGDFAEDGGAGLRPLQLDDFVGQAKVCENLRVFVAAARQRGEAMDHVLFHGPPGLGKTTLAQIVAHELGVGFRATSGPVIAKAGAYALGRKSDELVITELDRFAACSSWHPAEPQVRSSTRMSPGLMNCR